MRILLTVVLLSILLGGCIEHTVPSYIIDNAQEICNDHDGIHEIHAGITERAFFARCNDGYSRYIIRHMERQVNANN